MPILRAFLFLTASAVAALAQTSSAPLPERGEIALMQSAPENGAAPRPSRIRILAAADRELFLRAFDAASRGDWKTARALAAQGQNPIAKRLLEWRYALDRNSGATFDEIDAAIKDTESQTSAGTWPLRGTLQARAEAQITPDMPASTVVAWFQSKTPNSSIGKIRLGEALVATGETTRGAALIRAGWSDGSFDTDTEQAILQKDGAYLTPESDRARLDALLWRGEITAAKQQVARVDAATADIANARIALQSAGLPKAQALVEKFKDSSDPGLLFDWSRALRLANRDREAHDILLHIPAADLLKNRAARWWGEVNAQARDALASADPKLAYDLVQHAGFTSGDQYVGSSRVDLQACKLEYSIVSPK